MSVIILAYSATKIQNSSVSPVEISTIDSQLKEGVYVMKITLMMESHLNANVSNRLISRMCSDLRDMHS
jgi:hypothetical protein